MSFINLVNLEDEVFLDQKTIKLIKYYKQISEEDHCIENITYDDALESWKSHSWMVKNSTGKIKSKGVELSTLWKPKNNFNIGIIG